MTAGFNWKGRSLNVVKAKERKSLADEVASRACAYKRLTWVDRLGEVGRTELLETRARFQAGGYGDLPAASVARAIIEVASENAWKVLDERELAKWLRKK